MTSTTYITLNLQSPNTAVTVNAKQNDRLSRYISAALYDGSVAFVPPVGASAAIRYKKPDGTGGFYDADEDANPAIVITGSTALLTLAEQCTTVPGDVYMELNFYTAAGDKLTSFTWLLKVEQSVLTDATIVSSDYYNVLTAAIATALEYRDAAAASATAAAASATSAEYWAGVAQNLTAGIKGYFATPAALTAAYPTGENGWWAIVGTTDTVWVWDSDTTAWTDTGDTSYFYTKTESDARFATAAQGALADTAVQPAGLSNYYTKTQADTQFATAAQGAKADTALQSVTGATENNIAVFNADGKLVDGGKSITQLTLTTSTYAVAFGTIPANGSALANVTLSIPSGYTIISIAAVTGTSMDNINYIAQYYNGKLYARAESKWSANLTGQSCTFRVTFLKV